MKRPPKSVVEAAIRAARAGDRPSLSKAAAILGCSRPSLYTWIYQYGLHELAGVRLDSLDDQECKDSRYTKERFSGRSSVNSPSPNRRRLALVTPATERAIKVPATVKIDEGLWKRIKKLAIDRGCTTSQFVEQSLSDSLATEDKKARESK